MPRLNSSEVEECPFMSRPVTLSKGKRSICRQSNSCQFCQVSACSPWTDLHATFLRAHDTTRPLFRGVPYHTIPYHTKWVRAGASVLALRPRLHSCRGTTSPRGRDQHLQPQRQGLGPKARHRDGRRQRHAR